MLLINQAILCIRTSHHSCVTVSYIFKLFRVANVKKAYWFMGVRTLRRRTLRRRTLRRNFTYLRLYGGFFLKMQTLRRNLKKCGLYGGVLVKAHILLTVAPD